MAPDPDIATLAAEMRARPLKPGDRVWCQARVIEEDGGLYFEPVSQAEWMSDSYPITLLDAFADLQKENARIGGELERVTSNKQISDAAATYWEDETRKSRADRDAALEDVALLREAIKPIIKLWSFERSRSNGMDDAGLMALFHPMLFRLSKAYAESVRARVLAETAPADGGGADG